MKFVRIVTEKHPRGVYGLVADAGRIDLLRGGLFDPIEKTGEIVSESDLLRYLPPVDPPNILAFGVNYRDHADETNSKLPEKPLLFIKATTALTAHGDNIVLPRIAPEQVDYEAELCAVIGKRARNVPVEYALDYVFGYTCAHDVSARDCQSSDGQWARAKSFDTFAPVGPCVVTGLDPSDLRVRFRLNGAVMQDQSTCDLVFNVAFLVSYLSRGMTLLPGTLLLTGTPGGVGVSRKPPVFLRPGDVCEVDIEGIGVLRNPVVVE
jgi:2-keto-4-pentenoate hydratase/2-oxohepta-3-ene-1,7-dioic acid hydratase in catechol pathway